MNPRTSTVASDLQATLIELLDLSLQAKQAHWNMVGPNFRPLHEFFDELTDAYRTWTDEVAERLRALEVPPKGQAGDIAEQSRLEALPDGTIEDGRLVELFVERITTVNTVVRERMDRLGAVDLVSQDLLIGIVHGLEKQRWMLRAQAC